MSGQWEKYVEQAVDAVAARYPIRSVPRELVADDIRVALAAVGPLIAEDTRERIVAAAGRIVEREGIPS